MIYIYYNRVSFALVGFYHPNQFTLQSFNIKLEKASYKNA